MEFTSIEKEINKKELEKEISPELNKRLVSLVSQLTTVINEYINTQSSSQHKQYAAQFLSHLLKPLINKNPIEPKQVYYLLSSLKGIFRYYQTQWDSSTESSPKSPGFWEAVQDLAENKFSKNKVGNFLPAVINALRIGRSENPIDIDKQDPSKAKPYLNMELAKIDELLTDLPQPSLIETTCLEAINKLIEYTLIKGTQRKAHTEKSEMVIDFAKMLLDVQRFESLEQVVELLNKLNAGIILSRKEGTSSRSQDLEKILIETRDKIIKNIFLDEQSGFKFSSSEIDTKPETTLNAFKKIFETICRPGDVSEQSLAVIGALEKYELTKESSVSITSITFTMSLQYIRNMLRPELTANNRKFDFHNYILKHASSLTSIIRNLLQLKDFPGTNFDRQELCAYAYLINTILITYSTEAFDSTKLVSPKLFQDEDSAILSRNLKYLELCQWHNNAKQTLPTWASLSSMQEISKSPSNTIQRTISSTQIHAPEESKYKEKAYFVFSGVGARLENTWKGNNNWDYFPGLGVGLAIGAVPIASLGEHHTVIDKCKNTWKAELGLVSSALNTHEHDRLILKPADIHTWSKYDINFINSALPDNLKNIPRNEFDNILQLTEQVTTMWLNDIKDSKKELLEIWQKDPANAGEIFSKVKQPHIYLSHCKAGKTRSVTLALCCLAALYMDLHQEIKQKSPEKAELKTFLDNVVNYMKSVRPQIDMHESILRDVVDFAEYYSLNKNNSKTATKVVEEQKTSLEKLSSNP